MIQRWDSPILIDNKHNPAPCRTHHGRDLDNKAKDKVNKSRKTTLLGVETSHALLFSHSGGDLGFASFIQGQEESSHCGRGEEGKRTSWIARATILGFIYTLNESLTKLY